MTARERLLKNGSSTEETKIRLIQSDFCLDAGVSPASFVRLQIWKYFEKLPAQDLCYTGDDRIALTDRGLT